VIIGVSDSIYPRVERIEVGVYGHALPLFLFRRYTGKYGHTWRERSIGVGSDGMIEMVLFFLYRFMVGCVVMRCQLWV